MQSQKPSFRRHQDMIDELGECLLAVPLKKARMRVQNTTGEL